MPPKPKRGVKPPKKPRRRARRRLCRAEFGLGDTPWVCQKPQNHRGWHVDPGGVEWSGPRNGAQNGRPTPTAGGKKSTKNPRETRAKTGSLTPAMKWSTLFESEPEPE